MSEKRVAIVTGGTRGMGLSISEQLAKDGNIVVAVYNSDKKSAEQCERKLKQIDSQSCVMQADLSNVQQIKSLAKKVGEQFGRIDILVNNAGIFDFNFVEDMTEEYIDHVMNTNFKSQLFMLQAVIPYMKQNKYGRVANASSISGRFADVGLVAYATSKAAVNMMTGITSAELAPYGITVNAYAPGIIHTDMTDAMIKERGDIQVQQISARRFGNVADVARLVAFMVSPDASYITGEIIGVDGGFFKVQNAYRAYDHVAEKAKQGGTEIN
jgi:3-oxoacyl-[acyl-carrier protein] reductase